MPINTPFDFLSAWIDAVNKGALDDILTLYSETATLLPTFSAVLVDNGEKLRDYFVNLSSKDAVGVMLDEESVGSVDLGDNRFVLTGFYTFCWKVDGVRKTAPSRFTFVVDLDNESPIIHHHSSQPATA